MARLIKSVKKAINQFRPVRAVVENLTAKIDVASLEGMLSYSILENVYGELDTKPSFENKAQLWNYCLEKHFDNSTKITFVEYGVFEGNSIRYFSEKNKNPESVFIGLDSFEGLPEVWAGKARGTFTCDGQIPKISDKRVQFIKGWFQDSAEELRAKLDKLELDQLIVHYDADLYSSTLFALAQIDQWKKSYIAIFDEFVGHETRALYNYCQSFNATVTFLGKTMFHNQPNQVACRITPHKSI